MRIVYILTSLGVGGAEKLVLALAGRMTARGHSVALLVLRPFLSEQLVTPHTVVHLNMSKAPLSVLRGIARARRFLREFQPDIVHSHGFHGNIAARTFHLFGAAPAPISTIHNVYEGGRHRMLAYRVTNPLSRITTAVSAAARDRFVRLRAVPANKCVVLANGIDIAEFSPDPARRNLARAELGLRDEFVWVSAGRIVAAKDYPTLVRAFALIRTDVPDARLFIAGEPADPDEVARVCRLASELSLGHCMQCLGLRRDLPALLDAADAFVLASAWEGMPLVVAEAMAMEKPVVATDVGGTRELLGDCGALVSPRNTGALAAAMRQMMLTEPEARLALGRSARRRIAAHFSIEAKAAEWESLYESWL